MKQDSVCVNQKTPWKQGAFYPSWELQSERTLISREKNILSFRKLEEGKISIFRRGKNSRRR
jgi:hypothetical protein